ncbi:hypothetical protein P8452_16842 [Trifolium repens]|nr:hypothetical protein P8452_16842 [Trifolium repens]
MNNFRVFDNDSDYKMTTHKFRLTLVGATKIEETVIPDIPPTKFNFKDFSEIHAGKYTPDLLIDAIGVIHEFRKCVTASATRKAQVSFTLKDLRDTIMDCTLWDSLSVEFMTSYNQRSDFGPIVIIIKHARVKEPQGVYPMQLTNVWNGTKLLFDTSVPEIKAFLTRGHCHFPRIILSQFLLMVGRRLYPTNEYPSFHSYSTNPNCTSYFDIVLSKYAATSSQLTLQKEFGDYVRSTQEHSVMLCNQHIEVIPSLILLRVPPKSTAKFGSGWKDFCRRNGYQEGDKIRFKFAGPLRHNLIHVRKI